MEKTFSPSFKRLFLLAFTRELIIHSAKKDWLKLQKIIESKEEKEKKEASQKKEKEGYQPSRGFIPFFTRDVGERKVQQTPLRRVLTVEDINSEKPLPMPIENPLPAPPRQPPIMLPQTPPTIPEPKFPPYLEYLKPTPTLGVEIDLYKLNPLINDFAVKVIEVNPDERVIVSGSMGTKATPIILNKEDIDRVIERFSEVSKIPATEGIYKVVVGNLILSAVISETIGSRFIIKKMLINPAENTLPIYPKPPFYS